MPLQQLKDYLDANHVHYISISHSVAYTAQGIAALTHTPGKELAKTVIALVDGRYAMAVVAASHHVDLRALRRELGTSDVHVAEEKEFADLFPGCETGAMPPFGNLFGMPVFVDETLAKDKEIAFNAGSHRELIRMLFSDFERLVKPRILNFSAVPVAVGDWERYSG